MGNQRGVQRLGGLVAVVWTALVVPPLRAEADDKFGRLRGEAENAERAGQWDKARDLYEQLLALDRGLLPELRERFQNCARHVNLIQRHRDRTYAELVQNQNLFSAFAIYREVLAKLRMNYIDPDRTDFTHLFQSGMDEFLLDLNEPVFRQAHLPAVRRDVLQTFEANLRNTWGNLVIRNQRELELEVFKVARAARRDLHLEPVLTVLEFACGACNGLDENSLYLTPGRLAEMYAGLDGEVGVVGIDVAVRAGKVVITQVVMGSPAAEAGLKTNDRITHIDKAALDGLPEEVIQDRLKGPPGKMVELEVAAAGEKSRTVMLSRQPMRVPSVIHVQMISHRPEVGYFRLVSFKKTTLQEVDDALLHLQMEGMRVLIVDLRGNWGGVFAVAVQVAERFLPEGKLIVTTRSHVPDENQRYRATNPAALDIPLVVLVDGETASAAEVLAGALQDNGRATLVGQQTFGKGSVQRVLPLDASRAGIRITFAEFLSPLGRSYHIQGIKPDHEEERLAPSMTDNQLLTAIREATRLCNMRQ